MTDKNVHPTPNIPKSFFSKEVGSPSPMLVKKNREEVLVIKEAVKN